MFEFGKNWNNYSKKIRSKNIHISIDDLKYYLGIKLKNKKFLDIGCGSGLSSLAACKLGARVTSFDVDNLSTATTIALKKQGLSILVICENKRANLTFIENLKNKGIILRTYKENKILLSILKTRLILWKFNPIFVYQTNPTIRAFLSL